MKFLIVSHAPISIHEGKVYAYAPYVREMNLWLKHVDEVILACPEVPYDPAALLAAFDFRTPYRHAKIPDFNLLDPLNVARAIPAALVGWWRIFRSMQQADHIHLRVPGNIGLLGCLAQIFFPAKPKTVKYAGNWDPASKQPFTYRLQKAILRNTRLTRKARVLVYGQWPDATRNILPFFTASYFEADKQPSPPRSFSGPLQLMFVGSLHEGKQPLLSIQAVEALNRKGIDAVLHMFGTGPEQGRLMEYINRQGLQLQVALHGNRPAAEVAAQFRSAHFLVFVSRSEGWPKAVAESMFWGCVPITSSVSCVPGMIGHGSRGRLVEPEVGAIVSAIEGYLGDSDAYRKASEEGVQWARQFTFETFEKEIAGLLAGTNARP